MFLEMVMNFYIWKQKQKKRLVRFVFKGIHFTKYTNSVSSPELYIFSKTGNPCTKRAAFASS